MEAFYNSDVKSLLRNKFVVIIGDSIQRAIYKDLVLLLQSDRFLREKELRDKGEFSFLGDELIEGGRKGEMTNGIKYKEVRQYVTDVFLIRFYFITRCYNAYVESILSDLKQEPRPDMIIMNSCLWDITRYGKESIVDYKKNLIILFDRFKDVLEDDCLLIWNTTLPISNQAKGGFLIPEIEFRTTTLRLDILEANYYAQSIIVKRGFDVLDLHFYLRHHIDKRVRDGIHWDMMAHRYITNLLLSHICKAWDVPNPNRKQAPFSSYPQQYDGNALFTSFDDPELTPGHIHRQSSSENNAYRDDRWRQPSVVNGQGQGGSVVAGLYRNLTNMVASLNCCMPAFSGGGGQFEDYGNNNRQWHNTWDRRPMHSNAVYRHDPYRTQGQGPSFRGRRQHEWNANATNANGPDFNFLQNPMFPSGQPFNGHNTMFNPSSFEPYQQSNYQGASNTRKRNRHRPYKR